MNENTSATTRARPLHVVVLSIGLLTIYSLTATWDYEANVDAIAAALPAWSIVHENTIELSRFADYNPWIVPGADGSYSNRPPGIWVLAVPAYLVAQSETFVNQPATATAIIVTVAAVVLMYVLVSRVVDNRVAFAVATILGLGTSTWHISANALWPHGPVQLWLVLAMLAVASQRHHLAGAAFTGVILTRPVTAIIPGIQAVLDVVRHREFGRAAAAGAGTALGLAALTLYNWRIFGVAGLSGGYPADFAGRLTSPDMSTWGSEFLNMFFHPNHGVLLWSPVILVLLPGVRRAWHVAPSWARNAAVSGVGYLLIHALLNRASGGLAFGYRYPLAAITLATPLMAFSWMEWGRTTSMRRMLILMAVIVSIAAQVLLATSLECVRQAGTELFSCSFLQF